MFRFEHPNNLYALALIPVLILFFYATRRARQKALLRFGDAHLVKRLMPQVSRLKHPLKFWLLMFAFSLLCLAWANPQRGAKREKAKRRASDLIIALDISNSMLSNDVLPTRLQRAQAFALDLVQALKNERIGCVVFAGNAYLQMPLTTDYAASELFIKSANPNQAPSQGTNIGEAIDIAEKTFEQSDRNSKVLVIISDGEDHDQKALDAAKEAHDNGLLIFTIGVGSTEGGFIPLVFNGAEDYKRDEKGEPVRTKLNEQILRDIAQAGEGAYFNLANTRDIPQALKERVDKLEKKEMEIRSYSEFESYYQWFLLPALAILLFEFMMPYRKSTWEGRDIFKI